MRASISGFGPLVVIIALVGCSSEQDKEKVYRSEANAICAAAQKRLNDLPRPSSLAEIRTVTKRELTIRQKAIDKLGELEAPMHIAGGANAVFQDMETRQERARAREKAAKKNDRKKLRKLEKEARTEAPIEAYRASAAGFGKCARL